MSNEQPTIREHSPWESWPSVPQPETGSVARQLTQEAGSAEMARVAALNRPPTHSASPPPPEPKMPVLPEGFASAMGELVGQVERRGLPLDRDALLETGKGGFERLLTLDADLRSEQRLFSTRVDPTNFGSIYQSFARASSLEVSAIRPSSFTEQHYGFGSERQRARSIETFGDMWKLAAREAEPRCVAKLLAWRAQFEALVFGTSLLRSISEDGRVHHAFFADPAKSDTTRRKLFEPWRQCSIGKFLIVHLVEPLGHTIAWLADDPALREALAAQKPIDEALASAFYDLRVPSAGQIETARAVAEAFLSGLDARQNFGAAEPIPALSSWQATGRALGKPIELAVLTQWRKMLAEKFPSTFRFWRAQVENELFWKQIGSGYDAYRSFNTQVYDSWCEQTLARRQLLLIAAVALTVNDALGEDDTAQVVAITPSEIVIELESDFGTPAILRSSIQARVAEAFPDGQFPFTITETP